MYRTNINIIGSIPNFDLIIDVISNYALGEKKDFVIDEIIHRNIYGIRTRKSTSRFLKAIHDVFLKFKSNDHRIVFYSIFKSTNLLTLRKVALFYQFAINDELFYEITSNVFLELYLAGRLTVDASEFTSYLYDLRDKKTEIRQWSDSTIKIVASKYLTLLKKLDLLRGSAKKEFKHITPDDATIVYVFYLICSLGKSESNFMKNPYLPLLMISQQNLIDRLKKIALDDFLAITTLGNDLKIELKYSYEEIADVIVKRYQSKV